MSMCAAFCVGIYLLIAPASASSDSMQSIAFLYTASPFRVHYIHGTHRMVTKRYRVSLLILKIVGACYTQEFRTIVSHLYLL